MGRNRGALGLFTLAEFAMKGVGIDVGNAGFERRNDVVRAIVGTCVLVAAVGCPMRHCFAAVLHLVSRTPEFSQPAKRVRLK